MDNHPKPNWADAPPDAQAGIGASEAHYAAWYKRKGTAVYQICPAGGVHEWTWMGGRTDFPYGHEIRPQSKIEPAKQVNAKPVSGQDLLLQALKDCVLVMERDLNGLALIQPELKQAKQAIDAVDIVDAEFVEWNGEGLPPAGSDCEYFDGSEWMRCEVVAHRNNAAVVLSDCYETALVAQKELRPIRTPEQIEAEERDRQAKEMFDLLKPGEELGRNFFRRLYDKGFRKQVAP